MSDARIVAELIVQGAAKAVAEVHSVTNATNQLVVVQESAGVRQRAVYDSVSASARQAAVAAEDSAKRQADASKRQADAAQQAAEVSTRAAVQVAAANANARRQAAASDAASNALITAIANIRQRRDAAARAAANAANTSTAGGVGTAAAFFQNRALAQVSSASGQQLVQTMRQQAQAAEQVTVANTKKTSSIRQQSDEENKAHKSGITYLSVLSAIHAASFLASNRTFTLLGSFVTLGLAFGKVSIAAGAVGLAFGGLLAIFNGITTAIQLLQTTVLTVAQGFLTFGGIVTAAVTAAGVASTKIAADVETQLAGLRAFGGATVEQLREASAQSSELAIKFGVSSKNVLEAASLFSRAGGTVKEALDGATEAVIKLQVASQGEIAAAQAAIAVSQGLRAFNLEGSEAIRVADTLAGVAQASALSFTGVTQAFIQAAPGARTLGINIEDLGATMALLGNELVKGTITGTAFKQFLLDLVNPSDKAKAQLEAFGISIEEAGTGKIRPLIDILNDLNRALGEEAVETGKVTQASAARALAIIFESRAALAANILTREGGQALDEYRDKLEKVTASNIVNVLLLPLNKQLEILQISVEELGRAFGGPLLEPLRASAVTAINFFQRLIPAAELAGQIISTVLTNQGFGELQHKITDLVGNNALSSFLIEITNSFRNVYDVIINTIIPAIQDFGKTIASLAIDKIDETGSAFDAINSTIQRTGNVVATVIRSMADLIVGFVNAEGAGGRLRDTLEGLVTKVLAGFLSTVIAIAPALAAAIALMPIFARSAVLVAQVTIRLVGAFKEWQLGLDSVANALTRTMLLQEQQAALQANDRQAAERIGRELEILAKVSKQAKEETAAAFDFTELQKQIDSFGGTTEGLTAQINAFARGTTAEAEAALVVAQTRADATRGIAEAAVQEAEILGTESAALAAQTTIVEAQAAEAALEIAKRRAGGFKTIFDDAGGAITDSLANIIATIQQGDREIDRSRRGTAGAPSPGGVDEKDIERANNRIQELARDLTTKLSNLNEDIATKTANIVAKGLERIDDIFNKAIVDLAKLERDTNDRLQDIVDNITQRRSDRGRTDELKDRLDEELRLTQGALDKEEQAEERALDSIRLARSRDTEDTQRDLQEVVEGYERTYQRAQDAAERAFKNIQQTQENALQKTQDAESRALQLSLDAQSNARREQQQLAGAKTPDEKSKVLEQINASRQDRAFQQQQQTQLDALKLRQEARQQAFKQQQEAQNVAFSQSQETKLLEFRKANERALLTERRRVEDAERATRLTEENAQLVLREGREIKLFNLRKTHETKIRQLQDELENEAATRQAIRIVREANEKAQEIISNATTQAREVEEQAQQQLVEQLQQAERAIRSTADAFKDLEDSLPPDVFAEVFPNLQAKRAELAALAETISHGFAGPEGLRDNALGTLGREIGARELDLTSRVPGFTVPTMPVQVVPTQVINAGIVHVANMTIGRLATTGIGQEFFTALQRADQEGINLSQLDLGSLVSPLNAVVTGVDGMRRALGR